MRRALLSILAASALTAAIPAVASAQPGYDRYGDYYGGYNGGYNNNNRGEMLMQRFLVIERSQRLSNREEDILRDAIRAFTGLEDQYARSAGGWDRNERMDIDRRYTDL